MANEPVFQLKFHSSIGPVQLGMKKKELRKILGKHIASRAYIDEELDGMEVPASDYFEETGIKVEYDKADKVTFIEVGDLIPVYYEAVSLFELNFTEIYDLFKKMDPSIDVDEAGFTCENLCAAIYAPEHVYDKNCRIELASIFTEDYFKQ